ncbi:cysteine--tRNA ligase, cytoplasmic-like [Halichondria panicea]|uniref:cysteine--tRNA ligase, cytoplasmic-like n=1 Tax=Halichondria panicea TaxID=6063 RepID=UPI00312B45C2
MFHLLLTQRAAKRLLLPLYTSSRMSATQGGASASGQEVLKVYNSLTRRKEEFVPLSGRRVTWYSCGPTVYDASHMGHARSYITFDILRRVISNYFNYDVFYVMNITDVDDKIIRRGRRNHLLAQYTPSSLESLRDDLTQALAAYSLKVDTETDPDKKKMLSNTLEAASACLVETDQEKILTLAKDPLSDWLDTKYGAGITDHGIFSTLSRHWEEGFHADMAQLNVLPPDVLTRVSEYVPEVITYVHKIITNGFAYESNGSVYFDVAKFSSSPDHRYAKLVPEAVGDLRAIAEGEGVLSVDKGSEKHSRNDFALWKASKSGEPSWESPWGPGRPGWHIECSVMACAILGEVADIHTGGVDLKFPHHDNEIAQAEACYGSDSWMTYFLHSGHLTIEGCKMSKSLKNFITIQEALSMYSASQLRLAFLLHSWSATLDYSQGTMREAMAWEKLFNEFFLKVKDAVRRLPCQQGVESYSKFGERELILNRKFQDTKTSVHAALCDSIDTVCAMRELRQLVSASNIYCSQGNPPPNVRLLHTVATYITDMLKLFGVISEDSDIGFPLDSQSASSSQELEPLVSLLANFREKVRNVALQEKKSDLLKLCDSVRDVELPELGVILEDKEGHTVVKVVGKEAALREREALLEAQADKIRIKAQQKAKQEAAKAARDAVAAVAPEDMFLSMTDKYSMYDDQGVPTHDTNGTPLSDSQRKKLKKQWQTQDKKYKDYIAKK